MADTVLGRSTRTFTHLPGTTYVNETLVRHGSFGASPEKVTLGIATDVLEAYQQLHRVCPRLSIQAFTTALCHLHQVRSLSN